LKIFGESLYVFSNNVPAISVHVANDNLFPTTLNDKMKAFFRHIVTLSLHTKGNIPLLKAIAGTPESFCSLKTLSVEMYGSATTAEDLASLKAFEQLESVQTFTFLLHDISPDVREAFFMNITIPKNAIDVRYLLWCSMWLRERMKGTLNMALPGLSNFIEIWGKPKNLKNLEFGCCLEDSPDGMWVICTPLITQRIKNAELLNICLTELHHTKEDLDDPEFISKKCLYLSSYLQCLKTYSPHIKHITLSVPAVYLDDIEDEGAIMLPELQRFDIIEQIWLGAENIGKYLNYFQKLGKLQESKRSSFCFQLRDIYIKNDLIFIEFLEGLYPITKAKGKISVNARDVSSEIFTTALIAYIEQIKSNMEIELNFSTPAAIKHGELEKIASALKNNKKFKKVEFHTKIQSMYCENEIIIWENVKLQDLDEDSDS